MLLKESLTGNCRTCLIVTIADEQESISESQSTLRFGMTAGHINTRVTTQAVMNVDHESTRVKGLLDQVYHELDRMEAKGMHGVFNEGHDNCTREQFKSNFRGLREQEALASRAAPGQKKFHESQIHNYKGMLIRQLMTGIFQEPKGSYLEKLKEKDQLEAEYHRITGKSMKRQDKMVYDITQKSLMRTFVTGVPFSVFNEGLIEI